ncbi:VRR-NUC domain-containing protein [Candidatus Liberibacter brunswickensis]|uniref:VRR-NUC domain-containing protein n=1 Tax=Candidatus Liberibacter brunswickensis TaxID=1968796 RepID=UPI002FE296E2
MISEAQIEQRLVIGAKAQGCFVRKVQFISHRGCPDRLILTPNGVAFWIELKKQGGRLSTSQKREILRLKDYKQRVEVLSSASEVDNFLEILQCY